MLSTEYTAFTTLCGSKYFDNPFEYFDIVYLIVSVCGSTIGMKVKSKALSLMISSRLKYSSYGSYIEHFFHDIHINNDVKSTTYLF